MQLPIWFYLILAAGLATYIAAKAAVDAIVGGSGAMTAGRLALGQWMPIAVLAVMAMLLDRPLIAVGIVFSTAVACLSLATGSAVFLAQLDGPPATRRAWAMLVPAGFLAFLAGFRGEISGFDAVVLLVEGVVVLMLWIEPIPATGVVSAAPPDASRALPLRILQFVLAIALASVGAWLAVHVVDEAAASTDIGSAGLMTATMISPLLVLPIIGTGSELAQRKQSAVAVSSNVGVALLNVFALLPILVLLSYRQELVWHVRHFWAGPTVVSSLHSRAVALPVFHSGLVFPLAVWRVDVVAVIALGMFLLPVALGRWSLTRLQGLGLIFGYVLYLAMSLLLVAMREV